VRVRPPAPLAATFKSFGESGDSLAPFYRAVAEGGFGSGLVLVKGTGADKRVFVVTNRHVVELADEAEILLDGGTSLGKAAVVYADAWYDLAVLELPSGAPFDHGFAFATTPPKDQLPVVATGFPGIGAQPSYQTTRGYVSNERFVFQDEGRSLLYVQHTAPIDGGSSGGPLTTEAGALLGVNTMKLRGRENVGLAAPAFAVAEVAHVATEVSARSAQVEWRRARAKEACLGLVGELAAKNPRLRASEQMMSAWLLSREGLESWKHVAETDRAVADLWKQDPLEAMRIALVVKVWEGARAAGGVDGAESCDRPDETDWVNLATSDKVNFTIRVGNGTRSLAMRWERGQFRLVATDLLNTTPPSPAPAKKGDKRTARR
jgi:serine protease Do